MKKLIVLFFGLILLSQTLGCIRYYKPRRVVRSWVRWDGCRAKKVVYPCFYRRGDLVVKKVRCPGGRRWKSRFVRRVYRCRYLRTAARFDARDMP